MVDRPSIQIDITSTAAFTRGTDANTLSNPAWNRRHFIAGLYGMTSPASIARPRVLGIHHIKFAVSNLDISIAWYERVLGAHRVPSLDHIRADGTRFAVICAMPDWGGLYLELRQADKQAEKDRGWDLITLTVQTQEDLLKWMMWLDQWGTKHSPLLTGRRGWVLFFEDPDGRRICLYTREGHGGTQIPSTNESWLGGL